MTAGVRPSVRYLRAAFLSPLNLVLLLAGGLLPVAVGAWPPGALAVVAGADALALLVVASRPAFRRGVDARRPRTEPRADHAGAAGGPLEMQESLRPDVRDRFARALAEGRQLVRASSDPGRAAREVDRIAWQLLRVRHAEASLLRFLAQAEPRRLEQAVGELESCLSALDEDERTAVSGAVRSARTRLRRAQAAEADAARLSATALQLEEALARAAEATGPVDLGPLLRLADSAFEAVEAVPVLANRPDARRAPPRLV